MRYKGENIELEGEGEKQGMQRMVKKRENSEPTYKFQ
jgi:hypothetical protein